jgi:hypothetical protein
MLLLLPQPLQSGFLLGFQFLLELQKAVMQGSPEVEFLQELVKQEVAEAPFQETEL